jgi:arylsulfatase A-like enzyme
LLVIDTLRADHMSLYGYERDTTPAIAAWAEKGAVFENAWSCSSWTVPSMTMLLGGRVTIGGGLELPTARPLAEVLQAAGYRTGAVVANPLLSIEGGYARGFDHYEVEDAPTRIATQHRWPGTEVVRRGIAWLAQRDERPFFLFLHLFDPHAPYGKPGGRRFAAFDRPDRVAAFRDALPPEQRSRLDLQIYRGIEQRIAAYDSDVSHSDAALGTLFDYLEREGLADRSLVFLTADHGEGLWQRATSVGEKPRQGDYFPILYSNHGEQLYTEQVRVPLVVRGPGVPAGHRRPEHVSLLDVYPSVLALAALPRAPHLEGHPLFTEPASRPREIFSWCSRMTSVTSEGRWRLHWPSKIARERGAVPQLFDLEADPLELSPLADDARIASLAAGAEDYDSRGRRTGEGGAPPSPQQIELLQALGYAHGDE